jgi:hypothetical protein
LAAVRLLRLLKRLEEKRLAREAKSNDSPKE